MFHAVSGSDTTAFNGKGNKSVWQAWQAHKDVTETSVYLAGHPFSTARYRRQQFPIALDNDCHSVCQNQSFELDVNETIRERSGHNNQSIEKLPPGIHQGCPTPAPDEQSIKLESEQSAHKHS